MHSVSVYLLVSGCRLVGAQQSLTSCIRCHWSLCFCVFTFSCVCLCAHELPWSTHSFIIQLTCCGVSVAAPSTQEATHCSAEQLQCTWRDLLMIGIFFSLSRSLSLIYIHTHIQAICERCTFHYKMHFFFQPCLTMTDLPPINEFVINLLL